MVTGHSQIPQACRMNVITYQHVVLNVYKVVRVASRSRSRRSLNNLMFSTKVSSGELVLSSLRRSPFTKPFLTPGGLHDLKCVYWNVSVGLK